MRTTKKRLKVKKRFYFFICLVLVGTMLALNAAGVLGIRPPRGANTEDYIMDEEGNPIMINGADRKKDFFTILVVGADEAGSNTDTIMLAAFDMQNRSYNVMSIPRDTMANVPRRNKKINGAMPTGGITELKKEVFDLVGFNVDRYVYMELSGFEDIIDVIGGIEIDIPQRMFYNDPAQNLHIDFQPGLQVLTGEQALNYVRFRSGYADADLGRIRAQQQFLSSVINQMTNPMNFFRIPNIIKAVLDSTETDLTNGELIWLASKLRSIDLEEVSMHTLPGSPQYIDGTSYYIANERDILELINESFNPYTRPITSLNLINHRALQTVQTPRPTQAPQTTENTPVATTTTSAPTPTSAPVSTPDEIYED